MLRIGEFAKNEGISPDTLRYYEKIRLLNPVSRSDAGIRYYSDKDVTRLRFIKRAQKMGFSLDEIAQLLSFREDPQQARPRVRELAHRKLVQIEDHLRELTVLREELASLTGLCGESRQDCPILARLDQVRTQRS